MALLRRAATSISLAPWQASAHLRSAITLRWTRLLVPIDVPDVPNALCANLMGAANSPGSVMAKMIDAQSIVVASTATRWFNHEGDVLRYVFFHSVALACLVGLLVTLQASVWPFTLMVVH